MMPAIDEFASSISYSFQQLEALWEEAGGSATSAPIAAAIALAESGGNPYQPGDGGSSVGLWQIHLPAHPQYTEAQMLDPLQNAIAAVQISGDGANWMPWTSYWSTDGGRTNAGAGNGSFKSFLSGGSATSTSSPGATSPAPSTTPARSPVNFTPQVLTGLTIVAVIIAILGVVL